MSDYIDLLFTVAPHPEGEFIEAENPKGCSVKAGEWIPPGDDGYWRLRVPTEPPPAVLCPHEYPEQFAERWDQLMDELGEWRRGERTT